MSFINFFCAVMLWFLFKFMTHNFYKNTSNIFAPVFHKVNFLFHISKSTTYSMVYNALAISSSKLVKFLTQNFFLNTEFKYVIKSEVATEILKVVFDFKMETNPLDKIRRMP